MKRIYLLLALCMITFSCSKSSDPNNEPEPQPIEEKMEVTFNLGGEIEFSTEPLSKAASSDDLYGINIYQSDDKYNRENGAIHYAYGIFDDLNEVTVSLIKGKYYHFEMAYIPNGKNIVYKDPLTNNYGSPFYCLTSDHNGAFNEFVYSDKLNWYMMLYGGVQKKGVTDYMIQSNQFNDVERYQGVLYDYYATPEDPIAKINLFRMMVGFKIIINDFTEGKITLKGINGYSYSVYAQQGSNSAILEQIVELPYMPTIHSTFMDWSEEYTIAEQPFTDKQDWGIFITYTNNEGKEMTLYNGELILERLKTHVLEFSLPDVINSGIQANIKDVVGDDLVETEWQ